MQIKETNRNSILRYAGFLAVVFAAAFFLTAMTPLVADDFNYAFSWTRPDKRIETFSQLFYSMKVHRQMTHGRVFAQGWVTLFMMWPKWAFSIANAAVITLFFSTTVKYFQRTDTEMPVASSCILAAIYWICMPAFGQVFLWLDGACNYFWGAVFAWVLIEAVRVDSRQQNNLLTVLKFGMLLPFAFVVGAWSEHISFSAMIIQFLLILRYHRKTKTFPVRQGLILLCSGAGYLYLMLAPSMLGLDLIPRAKGAMEQHQKALSEMLVNFWWLILSLAIMLVVGYIFFKKNFGLKQRINILLTAVSAAFSIVCIYFVAREFSTGGFFRLISSTAVGFLLLMSAFSLGLRKAVIREIDPDIISEAVILFVGGMGALVLFGFAMYVPARGFCAPVVFAGIATVRLWSSVGMRHRKVVMILLLFCFAGFFVGGITDIITVFHASEERMKAISEAQAGDGVLITTQYPVKTKYSAQYGLQDLTGEDSWPDDPFKVYYHLWDIVVVEYEQEQVAS